MFSFHPDKGLERLGFVKKEDSELAVVYTRDESSYTHVIAILHKSNGDPIVQSYDKEVRYGKLNAVVGMTAEEMKLILRKMKRKGWA